MPGYQPASHPSLSQQTGKARKRKPTSRTETYPNPNTKRLRHSDANTAPSTSQTITSIKSQLSLSDDKWEKLQNLILLGINESPDTSKDSAKKMYDKMKSDLELLDIHITYEQLEAILNTRSEWTEQERFQQLKLFLSRD